MTISTTTAVWASPSPSPMRTGPSFNAQDDAIELSICLNIGIGLSLDDVWNIVCANNFHARQGGRHGHGIIHRASDYRGAPRAGIGQKIGITAARLSDQASTCLPTALGRRRGSRARLCFRGDLRVKHSRKSRSTTVGFNL